MATVVNLDRARLRIKGWVSLRWPELYNTTPIQGMHLSARAIRSIKLPVLSKMVAMDLLKTLLSVWLVLAVVIVSRSFIRVLDKAVEGRVATDTLFSMLALKTLVISSSLLPAAVFMALLMVLGRMYQSQEMSAVASAGGGCGTIYRAVYLLVLPVSVLATYLNVDAAPLAEAQMAKLMRQDADSADLRGIAAGKFSEYSHGDLIFYVEEIGDDNLMHKVFVQSRQNGIFATINSQTARMEELPGGRYIIFQEGERVQGQPGTFDYQIEQFAEYAIRVENMVSAVNYNQIAKPFVELFQSGSLKDLAEAQRRLSGPLAVVLFAFIAVPLAQISPRGGAYGNILAGFLIYFSHGNLLRVAQLWTGQGEIPVWLGGISVNLVLLLVGLLLLVRLQGWRWFKKRLDKGFSI